MCEMSKSYCLTYDGDSRLCQASPSISGGTYEIYFMLCSILLLHHLQYQNVKKTKIRDERIDGVEERGGGFHK